MLEELHIRDLALIRDVWLEFGPGMTVLTGETGAGKTALLGGLKLLVGERADSTAVRSGATEALVEGRFSAAEDSILAKRRVGADGRSRCAIDGEMVTVSGLAQEFGPRVDLHGQHEHQALLSSSTHCGYLDRWASDTLAPRIEAYNQARAAWVRASEELGRLTELVEQGQRDADYLRFVVSEILSVEPLPGEDASLKETMPALQYAERLSDATSEVATGLRGEGGALDRVASARGALGRVEGIDPQVDDLASRLAEVEVLIDEIGTAARSYRDSIDHDPATLAARSARLAELSGIKKKYGPELDDVLARLAEAQSALTAIDDDGSALRKAQEAVDGTRELLEAAGARLDSARRDAAPGFTSALELATSDLAMEGVRFEIAFEELSFSAWTAEGPSRVEFLFAPSPAQPPRPLAKIASGGEISRVMLALKGVLGEADTATTLVFDEVDAGIGGATAIAVGRRLARLAQVRQVIVVTHLAQVAAFADVQLVVSKESVEGSVSTVVRPVVGDARVAEIARMLAGNDSQASRDHADELLSLAQEAVTAR